MITAWRSPMVATSVWRASGTSKKILGSAFMARYWICTPVAGRISGWEVRDMATSSIRIGNQTSSQVPARLPFDFALRNGFDAFEWFSDKGRAGWCEADMDAEMRRELRK